MEDPLKKKSDPCLIHDLKKLVARERQILTQILNHLREVETRRLFLKRGYSSLFAWMRAELGYSEASAQRRIAAMRLIKELPEVEADIKQGEMSLSVVSQVQSYFRKENQKRRENRELPLPRPEKLKLLTRLKGTSSRECERKLVQLNPELNLPKEKTRPVSETRTSIHFTVDHSLLEKIERLKDLTSHQNPSGSYEKLFDKIVDLALERLDPVRREARRKSTPLPTSKVKPNPTHNAPSRTGKKAISSLDLAKSSKSKPKGRSRHISSRLRDQIWLRDRGRCQHRDPKTGKICGARKFLQLDHRYAFALGGEHHEENLRLLCQAHNQYRSELLFEKIGP